MEKIKSYGKKWLYYFALGVAIIGVYKILDNFTDIVNIIKEFLSIISPFLVGLLIAYLLYIPCKKIEKGFGKSKIKWIRNKSRGLGVITTYIIALLVVTIIFNFILPVISESVIELISNLQGYYETTIQEYQELPEDSLLKNQNISNIIEEIQNIDLKEFFRLDKILEYAKGALGIVTSIFDIFVTIIVSIYMLLERGQIIRFIKKVAKVFLKENAYNNTAKYFNEGNKIFFGFLTSQLLDAIIVGILTTIAMTIMGIKYAPLLGFTIGLFNIIPYIGAIIAVVIGIIITLITGGLTQAIWMGIVVIIIQQIDSNIINPKIIGKSLKISPLLVIFAVTVGGAYFGILGMFLAVPVSAILKIIVEDYVEYNLESKRIG